MACNSSYGVGLSALIQEIFERSRSRLGRMPKVELGDILKS